MRTLILTLMIMCSSAFAAEDATITQESTSIASPSSSMNNVQVNNGNIAVDHYGGGVSCSKTTGTINALRSPNSNDYYIGATLAFTFDGIFQETNCDAAASLQNKLTGQRITNLEEMNTRSNEEHDREMAKSDAVIAKLCVGLHGAVSMNPAHPMYKMCANYAPLLDKHHNLGEMNISLMPDHHKRVSQTKVSWGE